MLVTTVFYFSDDVFKAFTQLRVFISTGLYYNGLNKFKIVSSVTKKQTKYYKAIHFYVKYNQQIKILLEHMSELHQPNWKTVL